MILNINTDHYGTEALCKIAHAASSVPATTTDAQARRDAFHMVEVLIDLLTARGVEVGDLEERLRRWSWS